MCRIGKEQGPFTTANMRIWWAQKLLNLQLRVRCSTETTHSSIALKARPFMEAEVNRHTPHHRVSSLTHDSYVNGGIYNRNTHRIHAHTAVSHWQAKGLAEDRAGRQMAHYFDVDQWQVQQNQRMQKIRQTQYKSSR